MPICRLDNRALSIEYVDDAGVITNRRVNAISLFRGEQHPFWYLEAFCFLRQDRRTFRTDRILSVADPRLGAAVFSTGAAWVESLLPTVESLRIDLSDLLEEHDDEDKIAIEADSILNQHFHALRALYYLAKADKAFRAAEKRLYRLFLARVAGHRMDTDELRERCMKLALGIDTPTTGQFHYSVRQLQDRTRSYRMAVCATAKAMLNSDKTVVSYEQKLFKHLVDRLKPLEE